MFICVNCLPTISTLSDLGWEKWDLHKSYGPCEKCEGTAIVGEVSCQIDAYWDDNVEEILKQMGL